MAGRLKDHRLVADPRFERIRYERRPARDLDGRVVPDLHDVWIWLDNPSQMNSYTTDALRELILAFREASTDRAAVSVVLTATGDRAFCSGGNTKDTRSTTRETQESTSSTCGCSTIPSPAS